MEEYDAKSNDGTYYPRFFRLGLYYKLRYVLISFVLARVYRQSTHAGQGLVRFND